MKKMKEPNLRIIKFESMDVIATSGPQRSRTWGSLQGITFVSGPNSETNLDYNW